jgi:hypothetical protein
MSELAIDFSTMKTRIVQCLVLLTALAFAACPTTNPKKNSKKAAKTAETPTNEQNADVDFQSFVGRLRKAVKAKDVNTIAAMMTPDFAYVLGATQAEDRQGAGVFQYWDENGLWTELDGILSERFVEYEGYMVAPPQFADPAADYTGYRAGIQRRNGSWKFIYFVNSQPSR